MALPKVDFSNVSADEITQLAGVANHLLSNPATRRQTLEALKKLDPSTPIPEIDAAAPLMGEINALKTQLEERDKRDLDRETSQRIEKGRELLRAKGHDDEGIKKIEERMVALDLPNDYTKAAMWVEKETQFAQPASGETHSDNVFTMPNMTGLIEDPAKWALGEAHNALDDIISRRGRG